MWPWGHLAFGYLVYSLLVRAVDRRVGDAELAVLIVGTQLPDLVDKPLAWTFDVVASGYAVGHSLFVALPLGCVALLAGERTDHPWLGLGFVVGYWSHLVGDVVAAVAWDQPYTVERLLWPVVVLPDSSDSLGTIQHVLHYLHQTKAALAAQRPAVVLVSFLPLVAAVALWVADGTPGLRPVLDRLGR